MDMHVLFPYKSVCEKVSFDGKNLFFLGHNTTTHLIGRRADLKGQERKRISGLRFFSHESKREMDTTKSIRRNRQ